jgi:hypothetical protein
MLGIVLYAFYSWDYFSAESVTYIVFVTIGVLFLAVGLSGIRFKKNLSYGAFAVIGVVDLVAVYFYFLTM